MSEQSQESVNKALRSIQHLLNGKKKIIRNKVNLF